MFPVIKFDCTEHHPCRNITFYICFCTAAYFVNKNTQGILRITMNHDWMKQCFKLLSNHVPLLTFLIKSQLTSLWVFLHIASPTLAIWRQPQQDDNNQPQLHRTSARHQILQQRLIETWVFSIMIISQKIEISLQGKAST